MKNSMATILRWSVFVYCVMAGTACGDTTMLEHTIDEVGTIQIRAEGWWEICIPVYFKISPKEKKSLTSAPFFCYSPEAIESKELKLEIRLIDNLIIIYYQDEPNKILAFVSLNDELIYPHIGRGDSLEAEEIYFAKVREIFAKIKKLLENDDLKLRGFLSEE